MLSWERRHQPDESAYHKRQMGGAIETMFNFFLDYDSNVTVVNTAAETPLLGAADAGSTKVITPGLVAVGRTFRFAFSGIMGNTATPTLTTRLKLIGGVTVTLLTLAPVLPAGGTFSWGIDDLYATITAIGVGGSITVHAGGIDIDTRPDGVTRAITSNSVVTAVDFSVNQTWELTVQWSAADALNTFTYRFGCIDVIR